MNKEQLIEACIKELGVQGTPQEKHIHGILTQLYDAKPAKSLEDTYKQELLLQLKHRYRKKKSGLLASFNRYRASVLIIPVIVLIGFSLRSPSNNYQDSQETIGRMMQDDTIVVPASDQDQLYLDDTGVQDDAKLEPMMMKSMIAPEPEAMMMVQGDENTVSTLSSQQAIDLVQSSNPELMEYPSDELPIKQIKTQAYQGGRYVGFLTVGSGVDSVLSARCYRVDESWTIEKWGIYTQDMQISPESFDVSMCN